MNEDVLKGILLLFLILSVAVGICTTRFVTAKRKKDKVEHDFFASFPLNGTNLNDTQRKMTQHLVIDMFSPFNSYKLEKMKYDQAKTRMSVGLLRPQDIDMLNKVMYFVYYTDIADNWGLKKTRKPVEFSEEMHTLAKDCIHEMISGEDITALAVPVRAKWSQDGSFCVWVSVEEDVVQIAVRDKTGKLLLSTQRDTATGHALDAINYAVLTRNTGCMEHLLPS